MMTAIPLSRIHLFLDKIVFVTWALILFHFLCETCRMDLVRGAWDACLSQWSFFCWCVFWCMKSNWSDKNRGKKTIPFFLWKWYILCGTFTMHRVSSWYDILFDLTTAVENAICWNLYLPLSLMPFVFYLIYFLMCNLLWESIIRLFFCFFLFGGRSCYLIASGKCKYLKCIFCIDL